MNKRPEYPLQIKILQKDIPRQVSDSPGNRVLDSSFSCVTVEVAAQRGRPERRLRIAVSGLLFVNSVANLAKSGILRASGFRSANSCRKRILHVTPLDRRIQRDFLANPMIPLDDLPHRGSDRRVNPPSPLSAPKPSILVAGRKSCEVRSGCRRCAWW